MAKQYKNYVNGEWKTSENSITIYAPANGEELGSVPAMSQAEVDEVYAAAKAALPAWRALSYAERAAYLHKAADILERDAEKIGQVLSKEISKGLKSAIGEVVRTAEIIHYAAEEGLRLEGEVLEGGAFDAGSKKKIAVVRREPVGLVLAISPFNYPVNLAGSKIAPALIAGDVVAFKPPTQGSISGLLLVEAFVEAGIPAGVLNSITGRGSVIGDYIVEHKAVDFINFTGSTPVGENIGRLAAMRPVMLELGGKDAAMKYKEANQDTLVIAGKDYGMGSSRDWAAKGANLLGVKVVLAESFERIHRSNLVMMGILPVQFMEGENAESLGLTGHETFSFDLSENPGVHDVITVTASTPEQTKTFKALVRFDADADIRYYKNGGILPMVVRKKLKGA